MTLNLSLKQAWTGMILMAVISPVSLTLMWSGVQIYDDRLENALQLQQQHNLLVRDHVEAEFKRIKSVIRNKANSIAPQIKDPNGQHLEEIRRELDYVIQEEAAVRELAVISYEGEVLVTIDPSMGLTNDVELSDEVGQYLLEHWLSDSVDRAAQLVIPMSGREYVGSPEAHDGFMSFMIAVPIGNPSKAALLTVLDVNGLWALESRDRFDGQSQELRNYLLDGRGSLMTALNTTKYAVGDLMTHIEITRNALANLDMERGHVYTGVDERPVFGTMTNVPELGWTLVSEVMESEIMGPIIDALSKILLLAMSFLILIIWGVLYLAAKTIRPIHAVCEASSKLAMGDYRINLEPSGIKELDVMAADFNLMVRANQKTNEELVRGKELADNANIAKSKFLSSMSHELRTPLNAIIGFSQVLEEDEVEPLSASQKESVKFIHSGGQHLLSLVNEVLDLSSIESEDMPLSMKPISLCAVVTEVTLLLKPLAEKQNIKIEVLTDLDLTVSADHIRLKQVILNLISNAIKYNRENGDVSIGCQTSRENTIRLNVIDTGVGIPKSKEFLIFNAFNRLGQENSTIEGTGIGLALTKKLVELMGGRIGFESIENKGSTFWIELNIPDVESNKNLMNKSVFSGESI